MVARNKEKAVSNEFTITVASNSVQLNAKRQGSAAYTVFNASGRPMTGRAILETVPKGEAHATWLQVEGANERAFVIGAAEQFTVNIKVPPTAAAGSYTFRLRMVDVANTDEGVTEGPTATIAVPAPAPPPKKFPFWIIPIIVGVLAVIAVVILILNNASTVTMPDVRGLTEADAEGTLVASDLEIGRVRDEASDQIAANLVVRTEPEPDTELEKSTPVSLFISTGPDTPVPPPPHGHAHAHQHAQTGYAHTRPWRVGRLMDDLLRRAGLRGYESDAGRQSGERLVWEWSGQHQWDRAGQSPFGDDVLFGRG